ncbi:MAG: AMIN domain-containing protein, partial [Elusimicrobia bacterium]|nr:AMIN domain-containing protein [Elusimicrobiota bacterium]
MKKVIDFNKIVKRRGFLLAFCISLVTALLFAQAVKQDFSLLSGLKVDHNTIKIITSNAVKYNVFKISNPPRLVAELFNTEHDLKQKEISVNNGIIKRIRSGQFQNEPAKITRIVIDLIKMVDYEAVQTDNQINIALLTDKKSAKTETAQTPQTEEKTVEVAQKTETPAIVEQTEVKKNEETAKVEKPKKSEKPKVVIAKKQTVAKKTTSASGTNRNSVTLPKTPVTLEYQEADIKDVLQVMSIRSGINIIYGPDVSGTVSVSLRNVPFDQAFRTVLALKSLTTMDVSDNIIRVITPSALKAEREKEITFTKVFRMNYAEAGVIQSQISAVLAAREIKGTITTDQRTNSLIVTATLEGIDMAEKLFKELDVKPQQVSIEAKIVDVTINDISDLGVNWSIQNIEATGNGAVSMPGASQNAASVSPAQPAIAAAAKIQATELKTSIPVPVGGNFNFGYVTANQALNLKLGALITSGKAKILSNPKVTTINNKEASISSGEKVPYKSTIVSNGVSQESWQFLDAGITLTVTPTISPDGWITLKVLPGVSVPQLSPAGQP